MIENPITSLYFILKLLNIDIIYLLEIRLDHTSREAFNCACTYNMQKYRQMTLVIFYVINLIRYGQAWEKDGLKHTATI